MPVHRSLKKSNYSANFLREEMMYSRVGLKAEKVGAADINRPVRMNGGPESA